MGRIVDQEQFDEAVAATEDFQAVFHGWVNEVTVYRIQPDYSRPIEFSVSL